MAEKRRLNIAIDATWVADKHFDGSITSGALRVTLNLLNQIGNHPEHNFYLTNNNFYPDCVEKLEKFRKQHLNFEHVQVAAVKFSFLKNNTFRKLYEKVSAKISPTWFFPFIPKSIYNKLDIYHSPTDPIPRFISKQVRIKGVLTALDLIPLVKPEYSSQYYDVTKSIYQSITSNTHVLAISEWTKKDLLQYDNRISSNQVSITYLGADKSTFYQIEEEKKVQQTLNRFNLEQGKYFLAVNAFAAYKNFEFILENFAAYLKTSSRKDISIVILGYIREKEYKETLIQKYALGDHIVFLENVPDIDLAVIYNGAIAFLYMSLYEGFGLPVLEAMQCGTPVICSDCTSIPEVCEDAALLCQPTDATMFRQHLSDIENNESLSAELSIKGLVQSQKFSWDKYGNDVINAYESICSI